MSNRLNPTGRTITLTLPLKSDGAEMGEITAQILADDSVRISKSELVERLKSTIDDTARRSILATRDEGGFVPIADFAASGFDVRFDPGLQEIDFRLSADQRPESELRIADFKPTITSATAAAPAAVSGFVNVVAGVDEQWSGASSSHTGARLDIDGALRVAGIVVEGRGLYEGDVDSGICPPGAHCVYDHSAGFKRQSTRIVYDIPELLMRVQIGDTDPLDSMFDRSTELLGIMVQKSPRKLAPTQSTAPFGTGALRIDRASDVEVVMNGVTMRQFHLRPGNYSLRDLPLVAGANDVEVVVTDDTGARQKLRMSTFFDHTLLARGKSEWSAAAGVPSYLRDNERDYATSEALGRANFRYGIDDNVTGQADLQGNEHVVAGGMGLLMQSPFGVFGIKGAGSVGRSGLGRAADFSWDLVNFSGLSGTRGESIHLGVEYRSSAFHTTAEVTDRATGILYPEFNYWLRLLASYSTPLLDDTTATISGRYQFGDAARAVLSPYTVSSDRYGVDLSLSRPLAPTASASMTVGYSNEAYFRDFTTEGPSPPEFRVGVRVSYHHDEHGSLSAGYDSLNRLSEVSGDYRVGSGLDRWETSVQAQQRGYERSANTNASVAYYGNRGELRLSHFSDYADASPGLQPRSSGQRTSLRAGSSIAFADAKVAVGAPIRGDAFAIVYPHRSIADNEISIGDSSDVRARTDWLGPAVVTDLRAYTPASQPIDVADLPVGYSLGSAALETNAPWRAGYAVEVGAADSVSVYGTLIGRDGAPVALLTGVARRDGSTGGRAIPVFTNAAGRFGAEGLGPGRWIIEMATDGGPTRFAVDVPADANGLVKTGELKPMERT